MRENNNKSSKEEINKVIQNGSQNPAFQDVIT
jgi:hypothetical protein